MTPPTDRPMPWHDTAQCEDTSSGSRCAGPMVPADFGDNVFPDDRIRCAACGSARSGPPEDVKKTLRAHRAWEMLEAGAIHPDRTCSRCGWVLPIDSERTCPPCVKKDMIERQASLFPEVA